MSKYKQILVTGGAGFIGSHLVDGLLEKGYSVRVFDNLLPQVHLDGKVPDYLNPKVEFIKGDVTDKQELTRSLEGIDAVFHFAAAVGVGQSMYKIEHYVKVNSLGTAILLDILANKKHSVKKIIVAASMSSYGEGSYLCGDCGVVRPPLRSNQQMRRKDFEVYCPICTSVVKPIPTDEKSDQNSNSIYAITKKNQEEMVINFGVTYGVPAVALRFFNVYGTRQSLSNPYTGVAAIFMSRIKNGKSPIINEDGLQTRDFIHVSDLVRANIAALENKKADGQIFNVGTGNPVSVREIAEVLDDIYSANIRPDITYRFRKGDVRHCFADISKIKKALNWKPQIKLKDGLNELVKWSRKVQAVDLLDTSLAELGRHGLR